MTKRILLLSLVVVALVAVLLTVQLRTEPLKVSGFIEADEVRVGSLVGGRISRALVDEGDRVQKGDLLVELEPFDLLSKRSQALASLELRRAELDELQTGFRAEEIARARAKVDELEAILEKLESGPRGHEIEAAGARLLRARADLDLAQTELSRVRELVASDAATRQRLDEAERRLSVAHATVQVRSEELELLREGTRPEEIRAARASLEAARQMWKLRRSGYRSEQIARSRAAVSEAEFGLQAIERRIDELRVIASVDGVVEAIELEPGDIVAAEAPVVALIDMSELRVRAYVPEDALDLKLDQAVVVTVDSFPGRRFAGRIAFVAREAEFTPGNVQTPEDRSRQVFRIEVTLTEGLDVLRPGMGADVWLEPPAGE